MARILDQKIWGKLFNRNVVIVEDEALLRDLVAKSLEAAGFSVAVAANAAEAKKVFQDFDPDAVVLDIELGAGPNGFDFAQWIQATSPDVGIVFLTNLPDARFAGQDPNELPKGVSYLRKSQLIDSNELVNALEAVLHDSVTPHMRHDLNPSRPLATLSKKQIEVLQLIAAGYSNAQIAEKRATSIRAVEGIVSRVFIALGVDIDAGGNARVEAAAKYLKASGTTTGE